MSNGVCFLFDDFHPVFSGHSIYMQQVMRHLQARDRRITVICWNPGHLLVEEYFQGIQIIRINRSSSRIEFYFSVLQALLKVRNDFNCLHVNGFPDPYSLLVGFCRIFGKRIVLQSTLYGSDDGYTYLQNHRGGKLRVLQLAFVDAITAISQPLIKSFEDIGFPTRKLEYIPQGVDLERFRLVDLEEKSKIRHQLGIVRKKPTVLFVGTILKRKGVDWLLDAWIKVQSEIPSAQLVLVGMFDFDDSNENQKELNDFSMAMKARVMSKGLNVVFVGLQKEIVKWYQAADVFVLPSRKEGFGNVIIEAMACGLPVVLTPMDGVANETVAPNVNGFVVQDVDDLADKICLLINNSALAESFGREGGRIAREKFDLEVIVEMYDSLYFPE